MLPTRGFMSGPSPPGHETIRTILVSITFLALACVFLALPPGFSGPVAQPGDLPAWVTDTTPVRKPALEPVIELIGYTYHCSDCHKLFPSPPETSRKLTQHTHVVLNHGINTRCFNCHHIHDRDSFSNDLGKAIPYDQPQVLCAKCHGLVYRDWQHGVHGRSNGYWDTRRGPLARLKCIECHDPHQPAFAPMVPGPGPNTLRMGTPPPGDHGAGLNPLQIRGRTGAPQGSGDGKPQEVH